MKLSLNREYALRHLGVALLFFGLAGWFLFDGAWAWPDENAAWEKDRATTVTAHLEAHPEYRRAHAAADRDGIPHLPIEITRQFQFAGITAFAALIIAGLVGLDARRTLTWDDTTMTGSLTGGKPVAFADVAVDDSQWARKGILKVFTKDGCRFALDTWHHTGARELAEKLLALHRKPSADASA